jgi:hypothetical protein
VSGLHISVSCATAESAPTLTPKCEDLAPVFPMF